VCVLNLVLLGPVLHVWIMFALCFGLAGALQFYISIAQSLPATDETPEKKEA
jgi:hypothetical protein